MGPGKSGVFLERFVSRPGEHLNLNDTESFETGLCLAFLTTLNKVYYLLYRRPYKFQIVPIFVLDTLTCGAGGKLIVS